MACDEAMAVVLVPVPAVVAADTQALRQGQFACCCLQVSLARWQQHQLAGYAAGLHVLQASQLWQLLPCKGDRQADARALGAQGLALQTNAGKAAQ